MRWRKLSSRGVYKWMEAGQSLEGHWLGSREGNFGLLGSIETNEGTKITFPLLAVLADRLKDVEEGNLIRVVYLGLAVTQTGRQYKNFDVFAAEDGVAIDDEGREHSENEPLPV